MKLRQHFFVDAINVAKIDILRVRECPLLLASRLQCCPIVCPLSPLNVDGATHAAVEPEMLLHRYRPEHAIGVQFQRAAPERGLEDMAHRHVIALFTRLHE